MGWSSAKGWNSQGWSRPAAAGGGGATYVSHGSAAYTAGTSSNSVSFGAATSGDLLIFAVTSANSGITAGAKNGAGTDAATLLSTDVDGTNYWLLYSIILSPQNVTDHAINLTGTAADSSIQFAIYSGATVATSKGYDHQSAATDLTFAGFTPSGSTKGVVFMAQDYGPSENPVTLSPGTWATRDAGTPIAGGFNHYSSYIKDQLTGYANALVTASGWEATGGQAGWLIELT